METTIWSCSVSATASSDTASGICEENRLVGLVVRCPPREQKVPGSNPACAGTFSGSSHTSDLNIGTPVATLPGAWCYRVSAGTGRRGVSILWLGEMESWICNFYLSVAARKIVSADPSLRYSHVAGTLSNQQTNKQTVKKLYRGNCTVLCPLFRMERMLFTISPTVCSEQTECFSLFPQQFVQNRQNAFHYFPNSLFRTDRMLFTISPTDK